MKKPKKYLPSEYAISPFDSFYHYEPAHFISSYEGACRFSCCLKEKKNNLYFPPSF